MVFDAVFNHVAGHASPLKRYSAENILKAEGSQCIVTYS